MKSDKRHTGGTAASPEALATETLLAQNPEQPEEKRLSLSLRA